MNYTTLMLVEMEIANLIRRPTMKAALARAIAQRDRLIAAQG